jgi:hypothetical protein
MSSIYPIDYSIDIGSWALLILLEPNDSSVSRRMLLKDERNGLAPGIVASRKCPYCGHSEIGYTTADGEFHPLKPGTLITVTEMPEPPAPDMGGSPVLMDFVGEEEASQGELKPWVPAVLKGNQKLRVKYGVMVRERIAIKGLTGDEYRSAFFRKIEKLIEQEFHTSLPILLDRFFAAPHLASGNPRQISQAIWRELEEIRKPALLVSEWLERQDQESLSRMIHPKSITELDEEPVSDKDLEAELQSLTLEEFFEML